VTAFETVLYEASGGVALVTLNRQQVLNALNAKLLGELERAVALAREDASVKAVLLTGAGEKAFAAGADINELAALGPAEATAFAERGQRLFASIEHLGKPVVAAINGFALGGGCELAMACTLRVAAGTAQMGQPEVNLGVIPGYGGTQRLTRLVGKGRALDLVLTGRIVKADEALAMGLVNRVVPREELLDAARQLAGILVSKAPLALRYAMEAVHRGLEMGLEDAFAWEAHLFGLCAATRDMKEGTAAFLEKRKPSFEGR